MIKKLIYNFRRRRKKIIGSCAKCGDVLIKGEKCFPWYRKYDINAKVCIKCTMMILGAHNKLERCDGDPPCSACNNPDACSECYYESLWKILCIDFETNPRIETYREKKKCLEMRNKPGRIPQRNN